MKKVLAIVLVLVLAVGLFACSSTPAATSPSAAATSAAPASSAAPDSAAPASSDAAASPSAAGKAEIGFFDSSVDYTKATNYKIAYMYAGTSVLYDMFSKAFKAWAERMNCTYNDYSTTDADQFVNTIQTYSDQGYAGLLIDPDSTIYSRCSDLLTELKLPWMGCMSPATDADGKLIHPAVGFDNFGFGHDMFQWCIDYAKKNWPDATAENTGAMFIGFSVVPLLELRHNGALAAWKDSGYPESSFYFLDGVTGDQTAQTGYNLSSATMAAHPEFKYWVGCGFFDDYSDGIVRAAEAAGKADQTICSTAGGSALINHWDAGEDSSWKSAVYTDQRLYAEPIFCGLYAMITGQATAETLWPEWVNKAAGDQYATLQLPSTMMTKDMYKDYLSFVDKYTGIVQYSQYGITNPNTYPTKQDPPASYKG
jgi:ABC-type sugar transport system substrate-binding protein